MYQHGDVWISDFWSNGARYKKSWAGNQQDGRRGEREEISGGDS